MVIKDPRRVVQRQLSKTPIKTGDWLAYQALGAVAIFWLGVWWAQKGPCWFAF